MKQCAVCGVDKPFGAFPKNGQSRDGRTAYRPECKECYNLRRSCKKAKHNKFNAAVRARTGEDSTLSFEDWRAAVLAFRGRCAYCSTQQSRRVRLTREHVVPVSKGGLTVRSNIIPVCVRCNCSKSDNDMEPWFRRQSFFDEAKLEAIREWQRR